MTTITTTLKEGFIPFRDGKEHTIEPCQKCAATIKATQVNGPAVADSNGEITGAFFLNLWLCRACYERLVVTKGKGKWRAKGSRVYDENGDVIAFVNDGESFAPTHISNANAHLIAAAPEMYEALKAINAAEDPFNDITIIRNMVKALRKAEGE